MPLTLIVVAVIMLICVLCNKITLKIGIPMLFAFILLGMLFGSDGLFRIPFEDFPVCRTDLYSCAHLYYVLRRLWDKLERCKKGCALRAFAFVCRRYPDSGVYRIVLSLCFAV